MSGKNSTAPSIPSDLKQENRRRVLAFFIDNQEHTASEIAAETGISKLTVMKAIQFFCEKGILSSAGKGSSTERGGKRPACYRFSYDQYTLHISMWPDSLSLTLSRLNSSPLRQVTHRWLIPPTPQEAFAVIRQHVDALLAEAGVSPGELYGVSLSTAGIVDYKRLVLRYSSQSPSWGADIPVGDYLREIFGDGLYFFVENTGKCIGRAVYARQKVSVKRTLVLFTSWGISAAFLQDGRILNGRDSIIGEIGHMTLDPYDTEQCSCGSFGCAEHMLSVPRLIRDVTADPPPASSPLYNIPPALISLEKLFTASRQGDEYARGKVRILAKRFAALLRNTALAFDPELVVFVGDYAAADPYFDTCLQEQFSLFHYFMSGSPFRVSYDQSPLLELDAAGGDIAMAEHFISSPALYEEGV